jgi:hypothetical protein
MTAPSLSLTSVSAATRGIAEADSVGIAANAQAATPISNKRFMWEFSLEGRVSAARRECPKPPRVPSNVRPVNIAHRRDASTKKRGRSSPTASSFVSNVQ